MAFLDNSGDIILDAVLTDTGRQRMAQGTFRITKFALGDEEIDYGLFNSNHPSGSAFYDLKVMQTPVLESFTNNTSLMKSKLVTMTRNNILYLPMLKLNDNVDNRTSDANANYSFQGYILLADLNTESNGDAANTMFPLREGLLRGASRETQNQDLTNHIAIDQGIDTSDGGISFRQTMPSDLVETAYLVKMDHRLLRLEVPTFNFDTTDTVTNQFIDDDGIATYYVVLGDGYNAVEGPPPIGKQYQDERERQRIVTNNPPVAEQNNAASDYHEVFAGPLGSILRISPKTSHLVRQGTALFDELGTSANGSSFQMSSRAGLTKNIGNYQHIDTVISIVGVTTGYAIDVPIRIIKKS